MNCHLKLVFLIELWTFPKLQLNNQLLAMIFNRMIFKIIILIKIIIKLKNIVKKFLLDKYKINIKIFIIKMN